MKHKAPADPFEDAQAFRQQVRIAAVQVAGLRPDELATALAYEVEPFSHIPPAEAETVYRAVPDPDPAMRVYEVAVRRRGRGRGTNGTPRLMRLAFCLAALLLLGLAGDAAALLVRQHRFARAVAEQEQLDARLQTVTRAAQRARTERTALETARAEAIRVQDEVANRRALFPSLLTDVATACGDRAVLTALNGDAQHLSLAATALSPQAAADVLDALARRVQPRAFALKAGPLKAQGNTTSFTWEVTHD